MNDLLLRKVAREVLQKQGLCNTWDRANSSTFGFIGRVIKQGPMFTPQGYHMIPVVPGLPEDVEHHGESMLSRIDMWVCSSKPTSSHQYGHLTPYALMYH